MLYTRKGDDGTTKTFGCDQRISKSSAIAEALGTLDEINSFLGICKVLSKQAGLFLGEQSFESIVLELQQGLFIVQAELAGADKKIEENKVKMLEDWTDQAEKILPPIKTFFISGGTILASHFDTARTLARRAERRVIHVSDEGVIISDQTKSFLNRLSSVLYALARLSNHLSEISEESPSYS
jgi:cob(I)alamin adenosyltransferase